MAQVGGQGRLEPTPRLAELQLRGLLSKCPDAGIGQGARPVDHLLGYPQWSGSETTVMIRSIRYSYSQEDVKAILERSGLQGKFDLIYMPRNHARRNANKGYVFVNFRKPEFVKECIKLIHGTSFGGGPKPKLCKLVPAHFQGGAAALAMIHSRDHEPLLVNDPIPETLDEDLILGEAPSREAFCCRQDGGGCFDPDSSASSTTNSEMGSGWTTASKFGNGDMEERLMEGTAAVALTHQDALTSPSPQAFAEVIRTWGTPCCYGAWADGPTSDGTAPEVPMGDGVFPIKRKLIAGDHYHVGLGAFRILGGLSL